jgi:hypothetical protein
VAKGETTGETVQWATHTCYEVSDHVGYKPASDVDKPSYNVVQNQLPD